MTFRALLRMVVPRKRAIDGRTAIVTRARLEASAMEVLLLDRHRSLGPSA